MLRLTLLALILLVGCTSAATQDQYTVSLGEHTYTVDLAMTPAERAQGLMHRPELPDGTGMLFVYPAELPGVQFWMKNTLVPLDILYFDSDLKLTQIYADTPPCTANPCPTYPASSSTQYVLELPAGTARADGATIGQKLKLNSPLPDAK